MIRTRPRRRPAVATAAALIAGATAIGGCAGPGRPGQPGGPGAARPAASNGPAAAPIGAFCPARPQASLTASLGAAVPASLHAEIIPLGITTDGATAYVAAWTSRFAGVAALRLRGAGQGRLRPIARFGNPATDQADGSWGGRWLVWAETYSLTSLDDFTIFGWDASTGRLMRLGHSIAAPGGAPWPSPWHAPAVSGQYAAWAQGYGPGGLVQIRLANLRTGRVAVIARGHVQAPFFDGKLLVWPASARPGSLTRLHAYSTAAGRPVALPVVLRAVRGTDFVATDGVRTAYLSPDLSALYYSPAPNRAAALALRLPAGVSFSNLGMAHGALAWTTTRATYLASTRTGGYIEVTPAYGFAVTDAGPDVLVSDAPASKAAHPALALHVLDGASIGRGRCPG